MLSWEDLKTKLECPKDDDAWYENTRWCNRDLIPIPKERQTFGVWGYIGYWAVLGSCISAWSTGSTLLAFGLSPQQAIACVTVGGILTGCLAVAVGIIGAKYHIGFTVSCRFSWGLRGSYFPIVLRIFVCIIWFGIQAYWGGQAMRVCIGAVIPGFAHMKNYFSASSHLATNDFIGLIIWMGLFIPGVFIRPERLQIPFIICALLFIATCIGLLSWTVVTAGGPGKLFHEPATAPNVGWAFMFGVTAVLGAWGGGTLAQSDWTRYATSRNAAIPSQFIASPLTIAATSAIGIIATSAAKDILGEIIWNPITLLAAIQEHYHSSSAVRAAVFFGGFGMVAAQFAIAVNLCSIACGMDMAGLCPRYINIRRGAYIMATVGICTQPWQLLYTATKFLSVLSGFGVFMAPATGIMLADYHAIRRHRLRLCDLYTDDGSSIYWFYRGFNPRAFIVFALSCAPLLPGMAASVNAYTEGWIPWIRLYNLTFLVGTAWSFMLFYVLTKHAFPVKGLGSEAGFIDSTVVGVDGSEVSPDLSIGEKHEYQFGVNNLGQEKSQAC